MTGPEVLDIARQAIWVMLEASAPMMIVALLVGLVIALFQALTQVQEMTLVFVPKIVAIFLTLLISLPFMGSVMSGLMHLVAHREGPGHQRSQGHSICPLHRRPQGRSPASPYPAQPPDDRGRIGAYPPPLPVPQPIPHRTNPAPPCQQKLPPPPPKSCHPIP